MNCGGCFFPPCSMLQSCLVKLKKKKKMNTMSPALAYYLHLLGESDIFLGSSTGCVLSHSVNVDEDEYSWVA